MTNTGDELMETHVLGTRTQQTAVRASAADPRAWLRELPVCPALGQHQIAHVGVCRAANPYCIVRTKQSGTYFLACFGGEGRILVDGRWQRCRAGTACLLPPHILNAFHAVPSKVWLKIFPSEGTVGIAVTWITFTLSKTACGPS